MMAQWSRSALCIALGALALSVGCSSSDGAGSSGTGGGAARGGAGGNGATGGTSGATAGTGGATGGTSGATAGTSGATGGTVGIAGTSGASGGKGGGTGGAASGGKGGSAGAAGNGATGGRAGAGAAGSGAAGMAGATGATGGAGGAAPGSSVCGTSAEGASATLTCPSGQTIATVTFASFGTPTGSCGSFAASSCDESASVAVVQALCVGRNSCSVPANTGTFGDPCNKVVKNLAISVTCAVGGGLGGPTAGQQPFKGVANSPCTDRTNLNVSWYYNWEQTENEACSNGKGGAFVPMIWGHTGSEQSASGITSSVASFVSKGYPFVLGFNEPDNSTQSNIPVATAISLWPSFLNPAIKTVSPAAQANTTGQAWFTTFIGDVNANTTGLRTDAIGLHWYGWNAGSCDATASQLNSYLNWAEGFAGNRPIWLTEWGCLNLSAPDVQTVVSFYQGALAVFARHPRVQRYAWYPWSTNLTLVNSDGSLTALGTAYAAAQAWR